MGLPTEDDQALLEDVLRRQRRELHGVDDLIDPAQDAETGVGFDVGGRGDLQATFDQDVTKEESGF